MCPYSEGDDESIISFDSVSTLGRLLDRLGLDDLASTDSFHLSVRNPRSYGLNDAFAQRLSPSSSITSRARLTASADTSRECSALSADTSRDILIASADRLRNLLLHANDMARSLLLGSVDVSRTLVGETSKRHVGDVSRDVLLNSVESKSPTPESRTIHALHLRSIGKHREASYQLNIAASPPFNYPRAMYLYAVALILGNGVKQNDGLAVRWLSRCVLVSDQNNTHTPQEITNIVNTLSPLSPQDSVKYVVAHLAHFAPPHFEDAHFAFEQFLALDKPQIARITYASRHQLNFAAVSYYELGLAVVAGKGVAKDEPTGMRLLARAALLGYVPAMSELGDMWNAKSRFHKRDVKSAAAWYRCAELFGTTSIGNSWIYKDKYMRKG